MTDRPDGPPGPILRDDYHQPEAPDPVLDEALVLTLARRHAPGARAVAAVDESGGEARTYMIDAAEGPLALKTQRPHRRRPRTCLEKEAVFLRHLASLSGAALPVPRVVGYGRETAPDVEYTLMTRIPGDAVIRTGVEGTARRNALRALGGVLRRVHAAPQEPLLASRLFPADLDAADLARRIETAGAAAAQRLAGTPAAALLDGPPDDLVRHLVAALPPDGPRVALHSNPGAVHTFVDPASGAFTGLIDFGDSYVSHPALDLARWDRHEDRLALLEGYEDERPVDEAFRRVWRVACILAELGALASPQRTSTAVTPEQRVAVLRTLLEDLKR
jgi:aminoglycoside phosphotransferase (APT) family kinase protein